MAYPARLEVTTLLSGTDGGGSGGSAEEGNCRLSNAVDPSALPPVADTSASGQTAPLFVIADTSKRVKSAGGGVGSGGKIVPVGLDGNLRQNTQGPPTRLSVSPRPRSSPCIGRRRHTRVTPLPVPSASQQQETPPSETASQQQQTLLSRVAEEIRESCRAAASSSTPSKLPKWSRERRKVSHFKGSKGADDEEVYALPAAGVSPGAPAPNPQPPPAPWPAASPLDKEPMELATSTPSHGSYPNPKEHKSPLWGGSSPWSGAGMYTVPTINIASDSSTPSLHKKWRPYCASSASEKSECNTTLEHSRYVTERIHHLVTAFSQRASRVKAQITQPPTPSTELSDGGEEDQPKPRQRLDSMVGEPKSRSASPNDLVGISSRKAWLMKKFRLLKRSLRFPTGMEPQSTLYLWWLFIVSVVYVYNAWVIPLRTVFNEYQHADNLAYWLATDYVSDLVYVTDIIAFKSRIKYIDNGFWVGTPKRMRKYYIKSSKFLFDVLSLLPLDLLYIQFGPISVFRLPRLLKIHTFWEFFNRLDTVLSSPHAVRVVRTVLNMLYLIHLNTCAYYGFSKLEGIGSNHWVFQGVGNAYIRCFYFATKTATSIGKNPKPENEAEYVFMTWSWLMGVFVFALLIGQIRDILATATRNQNEFRYVMDQTQAYINRLNVPPLLQDRVRQWFTYTWQMQKTLDEMKCLQSLPKKMRTDIAINVHIQTLSKVQLFQDCDKALLRDLVLKLYPVLYLPGDYVCRKGEVGKEMYIVQTGQVMVMGGEKGDVVLATLGEGSVFGEISLLALAGGNRRTANVKSRGFSNLFVLSKSDLQATIKDYPEAQEILKKKAKKLIRQNEAREKKEAKEDENIIIKSREGTPKLLHTVLQVVRPDSYTASLIRRSSRTISRSTMDIPSSISLSPGGMWSWTPSPRFHQSSVSLEVPTRSSRRSSLEVPPSSSSRTMIAKTSMSESLPEEDEEEFLVVETSEMSEDPDDHPLGSPASHHSIALHLRSRSGSPQSVFSHTPPPSVVSTPNSELFYQQQSVLASFEMNKPQQEAYNFTQGYDIHESPLPKSQICSDVRSMACSPTTSNSSHSRYSTMSLTRQQNVMGPEGSLEPLLKSSDFHSSGSPTSELEISHSRYVTSGECANRPSSGETKDQEIDGAGKGKFPGKRPASRPPTSGSLTQNDASPLVSVDAGKQDDPTQQTTWKKAKVTGNKSADSFTGSRVHERNHSGRSTTSSRGSRSSRSAGTSRSRNSANSTPGSAGRNAYRGEPPSAVPANMQGSNEMGNANHTKPNQNNNALLQSGPSSSEQLQQKNHHQRPLKSAGKLSGQSHG
ncbi:cyclic nucleotide-gated channel beta-1 isoform X2 [Macrobrachium rosenbergii]